GLLLKPLDAKSGAAIRLRGPPDLIEDVRLGHHDHGDCYSQPALVETDDRVEIAARLQRAFHISASRSAAEARSRVESSTGSGNSSGRTRSGISVHASATASQPRMRRRAITALYARRDSPL